MSEAEKAKQAAAAQTQEVSLLDQIVEQGRFGKESAARERHCGDVISLRSLRFDT